MNKVRRFFSHFGSSLQVRCWNGWVGLPNQATDERALWRMGPTVVRGKMQPGLGRHSLTSGRLVRIWTEGWECRASTTPGADKKIVKMRRPSGKQLSEISHSIFEQKCSKLIKGFFLPRGLFSTECITDSDKLTWGCHFDLDTILVSPLKSRQKWLNNNQTDPTYTVQSEEIWQYSMSTF